MKMSQFLGMSMIFPKNSGNFDVFPENSANFHDFRESLRELDLPQLLGQFVTQNFHIAQATLAPFLVREQIQFGSANKNTQEKRIKICVSCFFVRVKMKILNSSSE